MINKQSITDTQKSVSKYKLDNTVINEIDKKIINDILEQKEVYKEIIKELTNNGISCSLSLVGGSVRDLIARKSDKIKDFDFLLTINSMEEDIFNYCKKNNIIFDKKEVPKVDRFGIFHIVTEKDNIEKIKETNINNARIAIVSSIINKMNIKYKLYENKDIEDKYLNKRISAIYKIKDKNGHENDLIVSNEEAYNFITSFDFEICKCYIVLESKKASIEYKDFLQNIVCLPGMLRDLEEKTITIKVKNFNIEEIEYFMNKHYLKLKEKFKEYKLNYFETNQDRNKTKELMYLNYLILQEKTKKEDNSKKIKNKI